MASAPAGVVWTKTSQVLKRELGEATFGSWLGQAALRESGDEVCLVAATGVARDWIARHAWRRIGELWAQNDPLGRRLDLKSRLEMDSDAPAMPAAARVMTPQPAPSAAPDGLAKPVSRFDTGPWPTTRPSRSSTTWSARRATSSMAWLT